MNKLTLWINFQLGLLVFETGVNPYRNYLSLIIYLHQEMYQSYHIINNKYEMASNYNHMMVLIDEDKINY